MVTLHSIARGKLRFGTEFTKIGVCIAILLSLSTAKSIAQQHYQLLEFAVGQFLQTRVEAFEEIPVTWNMKGSIQANLNDGITYVLENKPSRAERSLSIALKEDPALWQAHYYRAIARKQQRMYYAALEDLQAALKLNPKLYEAQIEAAKCHLASNSLVESESAVKRAIQIDKKRAPAHYLRGWIYQSQGKGTSAMNSFRECLNADSLYHLARIGIALVLLSESKGESSALNELTSVLAIDSLQQEALLMRSVLLFDKDKTQSVRDVTKLIRVNPNNVIPFLLRGMLLTNLQQYDRAFSDFQTVIKATSTSDNYFEGQQTWIDKKIDIQNVGAYTLTRVYGLSDSDATKLKQAYCLIMTGAFDKAIAVVNSTSDPDEEPLVIYFKAVASEHQGRHHQALKLYSKAVALDTTIADAYKKRGIYAQELKEWEQSIRDFSTVLRLMPDAYVIHKIRGVSYYYDKQYSKAISDYSIYLKHDSTNQQTIGYRGMAYKQLNQRLYAYIDFANSQNAQAFNANDMLHLVDSVLQKGDTTLALTALKSFVTASPAFTKAYTLKLKLHVLQNQWSPVETGVFAALRNMSADAPKSDRTYLLTLKGMVMIRTNHAEGAMNAFDEAISVDRNNALAYLERGKFLLTQNKTSKASSDLKKASALGNSEATNLLAGLSK
jgi:tetratricopeptide (TPR) repeat protein